MFSKIMIANRGEIACRIMRTARRLGIATVAVYSEADRSAMHVALADEAILLGSAPARESYLCGAKIIQAAHDFRAQAIHPGYGFLSENADFATACATAGLVFIGPPAAAMLAMGDKAHAKALMRKAGVPVLPGYDGDDQSPVLLAEHASAIGFPVLIKPSAGGGGKGMKIVLSAADFGAQLASAKREAAASFGDDRVLIEKYLERPRHVEVQVFADTQSCVHLFDRDCSIQRRHQKIIEEAPAPGLADGLRLRMRAAAVTAASTIGYVGAGTVEFLVAPGADFFFLEMNARLQVEHPVTEMITGLDLVEWQLIVAAGGSLPRRQEQIRLNGHAIEARIYAEDPAADFLPQAGRIEYLDFPNADAHVRADFGVKTGDVISVYYDPLIAKLIVWDEDRQAVIRRLRGALAQTRVVGPRNNIDFLRAIAAHEAFLQGSIDTGFIERYRSDLLTPAKPASNTTLALAIVGLLGERKAKSQAQANSEDSWSPWSRRDGWRLNEFSQETISLRESIGQQIENRPIGITYLPDGWRFAMPDGTTFHASGALAGDGIITVECDGHRASAKWVHAREEIIVLPPREAAHRFILASTATNAAEPAAPGGRLTSPMPGRIIAFLVESGAWVEANQPVLIVEAMKMEHTLRAPAGGIVKDFKFQVGDQVSEGVELVSFEADTP